MDGDVVVVNAHGSDKPAATLAVTGNLCVQSRPFRVRRMALPPAIAVELDLVYPTTLVWLTIDGLAKLRRDEIRHARFQHHRISAHLSALLP